ncbi:protein obstructor-E-like isoform X2 [Macrobrachium nipponense]|uniref:protein obstructor-E-like isoform X2 n=1 Tax=Macrobrachium nipponense TaxID=159736 RepID=UPI0030C8C919
MYKLALLFFVGVASAQFTCPGDDGFYPDNRQCDKYYDCYRGSMTEKLCPDGLVFDYTLSPGVEQCNYPFIVECPEGAALQPAQPAGIECPRQNGYFEHEDPSNCEQYYECTGGVPVTRSCATGLVFDEFSGTCQWAHTGIRTGCGQRVEVLADGFVCPNKSQVATNGQELDHARYVKPDDCRFFYICYEGKYPREVGCPQGTVFNDVTLICDAPENVPGCENYYPNEPLTGLKAAGLGL